MAFSKRERLILVLAGAALGALALDWWALTPLLERRDDAAARKAVLLMRLDSAENLLERRRAFDQRWRRMLDQGLERDPGEAESRVLHALGTWADEAGLNLVSLRPERSTKETLVPEVDFRAAGTGPMAAVSRFLWRLETADIPLKVKTLQLASRKDGADDLMLQVQISTLYLANGPPPAPKRTRLAGPEGESP